jgi:tRNA threonylcarbamoyladenosine biosynthesis protein TsaB
MIILTIRTDQPESEIGLFENTAQLGYVVWQAHRSLGITIHLKIAEVLAGSDRVLQDVQGVVVFQGPGSFTGLRIGLTVANTLAGALSVPIVGGKNPGWLESGIAALLAGQSDICVMPDYGSEVHITSPTK